MKVTKKGHDGPTPDIRHLCSCVCIGDLITAHLKAPLPQSKTAPGSASSHMQVRLTLSGSGQVCQGVSWDRIFSAHIVFALRRNLES